MKASELKKQIEQVIMLGDFDIVVGIRDANTGELDIYEFFAGTDTYFLNPKTMVLDIGSISCH